MKNLKFVFLFFEVIGREPRWRNKGGGDGKMTEHFTQHVFDAMPTPITMRGVGVGGHTRERNADPPSEEKSFASVGENISWWGDEGLLCLSSLATP